MSGRRRSRDRFCHDRARRPRESETLLPVVMAFARRNQGAKWSHREATTNEQIQKLTAFIERVSMLPNDC